MKIIDPHLHLINLEQGDYQWLNIENPPFWPNKSIISRSFSEKDLTLSPPLQLDGFVHIEAGFDNQHPDKELAWLERSCKGDFRSIAFADITADDFSTRIDKLELFPSFVGIRHILDDDAMSILSDKNTLTNLKKLAERQLIFEAQLPVSCSTSVKKLNEILLAIPTLIVVINHAGFPNICTSTNISNADSNQSNTKLNWIKNMETLASHPHCFIKASGWEMLDNQWSLSQVNEVVTRLIKIFGIKRVMLASNFPVANLAKDYLNIWLELSSNNAFSKEQLNALCFSNAKRIYKL